MLRVAARRRIKALEKTIVYEQNDERIIAEGINLLATITAVTSTAVTSTAITESTAVTSDQALAAV